MNAARATAMTEENLQEAARLRKLWDAREVRLSQREFGRAYKMGNQSAVGHFLCGRQPLNLKAAMNFAAGLHCKIGDFSPRLAALIATAGAVSGPAPVNAPIDWGDLAKSDVPTSQIQHSPHEIPGYVELVMATPEIRELIRLLPPADPHDVLMSLFKSFFDRGFDHGASFFAMQMLAGKNLRKE